MIQETSPAALLKITLKEVSPPIWRKVYVPLSITFHDLHEIIQAAMGWADAHLYRFSSGTVYINSDKLVDVEGYNAKEEMITILKDIGKINYLYDMGDGWDHTIEVAELLDVPEDTFLPRLHSGKRRCPPEDVGGSSGFFDFLETLALPERNKRRRAALDWYGAPFDPADMEVRLVWWRLGQIAKRLQGMPEQGAADLARSLALMCVRNNTTLEGLHGGLHPSSGDGSYGDVRVETPFGQIPWPELSRLSDEEMKALMKGVVDNLYTYLRAPHRFELRSPVTRALEPWDQPELKPELLRPADSKR